MGIMVVFVKYLKNLHAYVVPYKYTDVCVRIEKKKKRNVFCFFVHIFFLPVRAMTSYVSLEGCLKEIIVNLDFLSHTIKINYENRKCSGIMQLKRMIMM